MGIASYHMPYNRELALREKLGLYDVHRTYIVT